MTEKIRLLLVDDHTLFREGLARLLEANKGLTLVGHYACEADALKALEQHAVEVVLLDFDLGESNGFDFLRRMRESGSTARVLLVTGGMSPADTFRALRQGAAGIFLKHNPPGELMTAIQRVARGESWIDSSNLRSLVVQEPARAQQSRSLPELTVREQAVLKGIFEGMSNKEIASVLEISESYVKSVLQQLFAKTGVRTRSQLVRVALEKRME